MRKDGLAIVFLFIDLPDCLSNTSRTKSNNRKNRIPRNKLFHNVSKFVNKLSKCRKNHDDNCKYYFKNVEDTLNENYNYSIIT